MSIPPEVEERSQHLAKLREEENAARKRALELNDEQLSAAVDERQDGLQRIEWLIESKLREVEALRKRFEVAQARLRGHLVVAVARKQNS